MRVTGVLRDIGEGDAAATARLIDHGDRRLYELVVDEGAFHRAGGLVVAAAGGRADHDLDVFLRRPPLGMSGSAAGKQRRCNKYAVEFHSSPFSL
ncbi:hypothetical protein D3C83_50680 [compost metagenome]